MVIGATMKQLFIEAFVVGSAAAIVGLVVATLMMLGSPKFSWDTYDFWPQVALAFFIVGVLLHFMFEVSGANKWYCTNGFACKR